MFISLKVWRTKQEWSKFPKETILKYESLKNERAGYRWKIHSIEISTTRYNCMSCNDNIQLHHGKIMLISNYNGFREKLIAQITTIRYSHNQLLCIPQYSVIDAGVKVDNKVWEILRIFKVWTSPILRRFNQICPFQYRTIKANDISYQGFYKN